MQTTFHASLIPAGGGVPVPLRNDGNTIFGRGQRFGINDRRVSRRHGEIVVSSETRSVAIKPLSVNPSFVLRKNELPIRLTKDEFVELRNGDILSLLEGNLKFTLYIEGEEKFKDDEDLGEDATQLDLDALEEYERRATMKANKRQRVDMEDSIGLKKPKGIETFFRAPFPPASSEVLINPQDLTYVRTIGVGSCGEVCEADWRGTRVAVKKIFRTLLHGDASEEFRAESEILRRLRHPNIVLFMGTCMQNQNRDMCIVTEFIDRGSLREVLKDTSIALSEETILQMAQHAAKGMNYLHTYNPPIIHRDLKSHNLLVDKNFHVKVTDFGLAKFQLEDKATTFCGTLPWTAPEVFTGKGYSQNADVYSYGIVLWELITREEPYTGKNKPEIIVGVSQQNLRPFVPNGVELAYAQLMKDCWQQDPESRPSFSQILVTLDNLIKNNGTKEVTTLKRAMSITLTTPMNLTAQFQNIAPANLTATPATPPPAWQIDPKDLQFVQELGEGTASTVYRGTFKEQTVAIKILKETTDGKHKEDFEKELQIMSTIRSPHVVHFYGACLSPQLAIVTEYLPMGSIDTLMNRKDFQFDWETVIKLCIGSATGLNTLHTWTPPILHRDVKPANCLVDEQCNVKICDFGLARFYSAESPDQSLSKLRGTYSYAAPETYKGASFTTSSDVFSWSILVWELVTRCITGAYCKPYSEHKNLKFDFQIIIQTAKNGLRPVIHSSTPAPFVELMQQCWDPLPSTRPNFATILQTLQRIRQLFEKEQAIKQQLKM